jgi:hypothetical protein
LSLIVTEALRTPVAAGVNVTLIEQLTPAAKLVPQLLACEKSPLLVPVIEMLVRFKAAPPVFERVIVSGVLGEPTDVLEKVSDAGPRFAAAATTPVPVNEIACGLLAPLSEILTAAFSAPD